MKRILMLGLVLLLGLGFGLSYFHHHTDGQDCSICKMLGSAADGTRTPPAQGAPCLVRALPAPPASAHVPSSPAYTQSPLRAPPLAG